MLGLKDRCTHPDTGKPYIVSASGGKDNSPEGAQVSSVHFIGSSHTHGRQGGFTHGFVVEFASTKDRDYYVSADHVHQGFVKANGSRFDDVRVVDYEKGVY